MRTTDVSRKRAIASSRARATKILVVAVVVAWQRLLTK
jgi:hypothetical protein